jgi:hypothetical protein
MARLKDSATRTCIKTPETESKPPTANALNTLGSLSSIIKVLNPGELLSVSKYHNCCISIFTLPETKPVKIAVDEINIRPKKIKCVCFMTRQYHMNE